MAETPFAVPVWFDGECVLVESLGWPTGTRITRAHPNAPFTVALADTPERCVAIVGENKAQARIRQSGFSELDTNIQHVPEDLGPNLQSAPDGFDNLPTDSNITPMGKRIDALTGEFLTDEVPTPRASANPAFNTQSSNQSNFNNHAMNTTPAASPLDSTYTVKVVPTVDGITVKRHPYATAKKTLAGGALQYKNRFVLADGSAVFTVSLTQNEALAMAADAKPMQKQALGLDREAAALQFEQNRLRAALTGTPEGATPINDAERQSAEERLLQIDARFEAIGAQREAQQIESLPMLDDLLKNKIVAFEWEDEGELRRVTDIDGLLEDLEMKTQISDLLIGGVRSESQGGKPFLASR